MICPECEKERDEKDFFVSKSECYKCVFSKKMKDLRNKKYVGLCRICGDKCEKKRWVYCSENCSAIGKKSQKERYWTLNVKSVYY